MAKLILMAGLPQSGKSTRAKASGYPIVNPDSIRWALHGHAFYPPAEDFVWAMAYLMVDALFRAGHETVVVDATNTTEKRRKPWYERFPKVEVELKVIDTPPAVCIQRARDNKREDLVDVIHRMAAQWDLPKPKDWE